MPNGMPFRISSTTTTSISATPEEIFDRLSDLTQHSQWAAHPTRIEAVSEGPPEVGRRYSSTVHSLGRDVIGDIGIIELERPWRFVFTVDQSNGHFVEEYTIRTQDNRTVLEQRISGRVSLMNWLMFVLFDPILGRPARRKFHDGLKATVESAVGGI